MSLILKGLSLCLSRLEGMHVIIIGVYVKDAGIFCIGALDVSFEFLEITL